MMLARQSKPMEMSSPALVLRPLWQATQRSEVRNSISEILIGGLTCVNSDVAAGHDAAAVRG